MSLRLGDRVPNFQADSTIGTIDFDSWRENSWVVLFSHPADFTPVCTTELGRVAQLKEQWAARDVKPIALSVDSAEEHGRWIPDIEEVNDTTVDYPIIADEDKRVAELFDMIHPEEGDTSSVRSVFVINPEGKLRLSLTYPKSAGRNFDEIVRVVDALQLAEAGNWATPADWTKGDKAIVTLAVPTEDAQQQFADLDVVKPYLRYATPPQA